jgi:hypothetical protein
MAISIRWMALLPLVAVSTAQQQDVAQQIQQLSSPGRAEALGAKLLQEARGPGAAVAAVWQTGDAAARQNARAVLNEMEEAAIHPLMSANGNLAPDEQVWRMTMVVDSLADLRKNAAALLDRQLTNKEPAPRPSMPGAEESEASRRVCDEAYIQMSRLMAVDPQSEAFLLRMRQFRRMPEAGRDSEIHRARQSAAWRSLLR